MKSRTIIVISGFILLIIMLRGFFGGTKEVVSTDIPTRTPKIIQSQIVGKSPFTEIIHVTGKISPVRETIVSTQGTGFIGSIGVKIGDTVNAGQVLARISDTYGLSGNAVNEATLGVTSANLSGNNSTSSLDQALETARIALERAKKDYDASKLSNDTTKGNLSKAQLDLENYITTQEKTLSGYETSYQNQLQIFQSFIANVIDTTDTIMGVSEARKNQNNNYEHLLGFSAISGDKRNIAENGIRDLLNYGNWSPATNMTLAEKIAELQKIYNTANTVLRSVEEVLNYTISDGVYLTTAMLSTFKANIDTLQTQYNSISTGLVTFLNTSQSFLATYEKEKLAREQGVQIAAENSFNALQLAQKAFETAQKAQEIGNSLGDISRNTASIRLQNAEGNAAKMNILSPFSGVVIAKNIEIGSLASPGTNLFTIGDTSSMIVKTEVSTEQQKYLHVGQDITINFGGRTILAKLSSLSAGPDPQTRLYKVEILLPKMSSKLTLGDIVDVLLPGAPISKSPAENHIVIPYSALKNLGQETYAVYVISIEDEKNHTGIVHERLVKIGESNENSVTIVEGLNLGEHIVSIGTLGVEDGDYVQEPIPNLGSGDIEQ